MSLDVCLRRNISADTQEWEARKAESIMEAGEMKGLIPLIEEYYNDRKPKEGEDDLYEANITHNLGKMAEEAGVYKHVWRPEELGIVTAKELIEPLRNGLEKLKGNPSHYEKFDAANKWGTYKDFIPFVEKYLNACIEYPDAIIHVNR